LRRARKSFRSPEIHVKAYSRIRQSLHLESDLIPEIKLIPAVCPRCGANLSLPEDLKKAHCMYCGTEILLAKTGVIHKVECRACDGFGRLDICPVCDGSGKCTWYTNIGGDLFSMGYHTHCENGLCSGCKGTGRYFLSGCPGCGGTGRCPRCYGTDKCAACRGIGFMPSPNGADKCQACDGTGLVDIDSHSDPLAGRCPQCKRVWHEDRPDCWYCGFKRNSCPSCGAVWVTGSLSCSKCGFGKSPEEKKT
jgi:DNA-directed RNA polymerase subunit RPC12/RpoP